MPIMARILYTHYKFITKLKQTIWQTILLQQQQQKTIDIFTRIQFEIDKQTKKSHQCINVSRKWYLVHVDAFHRISLWPPFTLCYYI